MIFAPSEDDDEFFREQQFDCPPGTVRCALHAIHLRPSPSVTRCVRSHPFLRLLNFFVHVHKKYVLLFSCSKSQSRLSRSCFDRPHSPRVAGLNRPERPQKWLSGFLWGKPFTPKYRSSSTSGGGWGSRNMSVSLEEESHEHPPTCRTPPSRQCGAIFKRYNVPWAHKMGGTQNPQLYGLAYPFPPF